jgi:hypothetical protein
MRAVYQCCKERQEKTQQAGIVASRGCVHISSKRGGREPEQSCRADCVSRTGQLRHVSPERSSSYLGVLLACLISGYQLHGYAADLIICDMTSIQKLLCINFLRCEALDIGETKHVIQPEKISGCILISEALRGCENVYTDRFEGLAAACPFQVRWQYAQVWGHIVAEHTGGDVVIIHAKGIEHVIACAHHREAESEG